MLDTDLQLIRKIQPSRDTVMQDQGRTRITTIQRSAHIDANFR